MSGILSDMDMLAARTKDLNWVAEGDVKVFEVKDWFVIKATGSTSTITLCKQVMMNGIPVDAKFGLGFNVAESCLTLEQQIDEFVYTGHRMSVKPAKYNGNILV